MVDAHHQDVVNASKGGLDNVAKKVKNFKFRIKCMKFSYRTHSAICNPRCKNGGECTHPGHCTCNSDWTGSTCEQRMYYVAI